MVRMSASERREAIVAAALPLFAEDGYSAVTTREIADRAGVSEALLYRHFSGKDAIYQAIQDSCVASATESVDRLVALPDNTETLIICIYVMMWKIQQGPKKDRERKELWHRLLCRSVISDGKFAADFLRRTSLVWIDKMRSCLHAAIEAGDVRASHTDAELGVWLAEHVSVMVRLYALSGTDIIPYPVPREELLSKSIQFCLRGLGMTDEAIRLHYSPAKFSFLLEESESSP